MNISIDIDITIYMLPSIEIIASMNCKCRETKANNQGIKIKQAVKSLEQLVILYGTAFVLLIKFHLISEDGEFVHQSNI